MLEAKAQYAAQLSELRLKELDAEADIEETLVLVVLCPIHTHYSCQHLVLGRLDRTLRNKSFS